MRCDESNEVRWGFANQLTMASLLAIADGSLRVVMVKREDPSVGLAHLALVQGERLQCLCDKFPGTVTGLVRVDRPMPLCYRCQRAQEGYEPPER